MLLYAGIDEAGYGPMLGPLCVGAFAFRLAEGEAAEGPPELWKSLASVVCRSPADSKKRIAVADSKKLKTANSGKSHPLRHLERGVLAFTLAGAEDASIPDDEALLTRWGLDLARLQSKPWYRTASPLPLATTADRIGIEAAKVRRAMRAAGIEMLPPMVEAIDEERFNRLCATAGKAHVNFVAAMRLVDRLWQAHPEDHPRVMIDRHGGRNDYVEPLLRAFPGIELTVLGQTERVSRYRLERAGSSITLSFETECETRHFPTALASMAAKFTRELLMARFNRYFAAISPEVKPTAGYVQDARRWLSEIGPTLRSRGLRREDLVRMA
ncbi:MAG: hypothetical protein ACO3Y3_09815 [Phycisphaerales bacterium]|jgi:hypothetical protein